MDHANIRVRDCPRGDHHYSEFIEHSEAATVYHRPEWLDSVEDAFEMLCYRLLAQQGREPVGVLPLGHVRSVIFGNYLTSVPFGNFGGIVARSTEAAAALLAHATELARSLGSKWIELRHIDPLPLPLVEHTRKARQRVKFAETPDALWEALPKQMRKHVRKAEKSGLTCEFAGAERLDDFYYVFARNMRDLGTPVYPRRFFSVLWQNMGDALRVLVIRLPTGEPIASLILLHYRDQIESPWASSLREYNHLCPNNLMFWSAFKYGCEKGYRYYDFGTSDWDSGVFIFKKQWGADERPLHRQFWLADGQEMPHLNPSNPRFRRKIELWQKLPLCVANTVGPVLAAKLP